MGLAATSALWLQLDTVLRLYAAFFAPSGDEFCRTVLDGKQVDRLRSVSGERMKDKWLAQQLAERYPWVVEVYRGCSAACRNASWTIPPSPGDRLSTAGVSHRLAQRPAQPRRRRPTHRPRKGAQNSEAQSGPELSVQSRDGGSSPIEPRLPHGIADRMPHYLGVHDGCRHALREGRQPLDLACTDYIVRLARRIAHADGRANSGQSALGGYLVAVGHQEADTMAATACAEQRADLIFLAVIDNPVGKRFRYAVNRFV